MDWGAVPVMMQLLRNRGGAVAPQTTPQHVAAQRANQEPWHEAAPETVDNTDDVSTDGRSPSEASSTISEGVSSSSSRTGSSGSTSDGSDSGHENAMHSKYRTSGPFRAASRSPVQQGAAGGAAAGAAAAGGKAVGPELVLEQAAGLACMLCHNPDNHFALVNQGIVPLLVGLLQQGQWSDLPSTMLALSHSGQIAVSALP